MVRHGSCRCMIPIARPIAKGRLGRPVEFGYKAQIVDNEDGVILDHNIEIGQPARRADARPRDRTRRPPGRSSATRESPRIAATANNNVEDQLARRRRTTSRVTPQRQTQRCAPRDREPARVQEDGQVANRLRRPHQLRQTRLRSRPNPHRRHRRRPNMVRTRHLQPQPRQDRRTHRLTRPPATAIPPRTRQAPLPTHPDKEFFRGK